jgi:hypothetical protein
MCALSSERERESWILSTTGSEKKINIERKKILHEILTHFLLSSPCYFVVRCGIYFLSTNCAILCAWIYFSAINILSRWKIKKIFYLASIPRRHFYKFHSTNASLLTLSHSILTINYFFPPLFHLFHHHRTKKSINVISKERKKSHFWPKKQLSKFLCSLSLATAVLCFRKKLMLREIIK